MRIDGATLSTLKLKEALTTAAPARGEFFPSRVEATAGLRSADAIAKALLPRLGDGLFLGAPETVWVPRRGMGFRPVPDVPFLTRVILTALSDQLVRLLSDIDPSPLSRAALSDEEGARSEFEQEVLDHPGAKWVVLGDVASFYEYVDHEALRREILEWSGDAGLASATLSCLNEVVGRQFGLPQGPRASDVYADLYLGQVDRQLVRAGASAYRLNDDFMLPAKSRSEGDRLLARLEAALRGRGLALNHA